MGCFERCDASNPPVSQREYGCVFVFEGYRGGGRSTAVIARLLTGERLFDSCPCHAAIQDEAIVNAAWQRQIRSVFATFDTRYKPVLTFVHDYLHFVVRKVD